MKYTIEYTIRAQSDLDDIYKYIALTLLSPDVAENMYSEITKSIRSLDSMPMRNPVIDNEPWKSRGLRKIIVKNYVVFYTVDNQSVRIIRIFYGGRDIKSQLMY